MPQEERKKDTNQKNEWTWKEWGLCSCLMLAFICFDLRKELPDFWSIGQGWVEAQREYVVTVDYDTPLDGIEQEFDTFPGVYKRLIPIFSRPEGKPRQVLTFRIAYPFGLYRDLCNETILANIKESDQRPATFAELRAFAKQFPDAQRKHSIIALGPGTGFVPILGANESEGRFITVHALSGECDLPLVWGDIWRADGARFLVVQLSPDG